MKRLFFSVITVIFFMLSIGSYAVARSLYWDTIVVNAYLDENGKLTIEEQQTFIFNGEWNGGERLFNIGTGEKFSFNWIKRYDETSGEYIKLIDGDIDKIDHYSWPSSNNLRWRSRLTEDPHFNNKKILYVINYSFENVLKKVDGKYKLDFDFLFPDRDGEVKTYELYLKLHKNWICPQGNEYYYKATNMQPGNGYIVNLNLDYSGKNTPYAKCPLSKTEINIGILAAFCIFLYFLVRSVKRDYSRGRFINVPVLDNVDEKYLNENLFYLLPEEVGALWDDTVDGPEVPAILARLVSEKKIESELIPNPKSFLFFNKKILQLKLLVPIDSFDGYEKKLIKGLFVNNRTATNTNAIQEYYKKKSKAFDPKIEILPGLLLKIKEYGKFKDEKIGGKEYIPALFLFLCFVFITLFTGLFWGITYAVLPLITGILMFFLTFLPGLVLISFITFKYLGQMTKTIINLFIFAGLPFIALFISVYFATDEIYNYQFLGIVCITLSLSQCLTVINRTKNSAEKLKFRRTLNAIKNYFEDELSKEKPNLKDEWFPYFVAFGLAKHLDSWSRRFGKSVFGFSSSHSNISTGSSGGYGFTGGGGLFGGAGATGAWIAATGSMASAASSSSSSSGGGGGGSSGGGGGGGW